ncbi:5-dehydro-4-deoxy-D-glucuronate isomerase [Arenibacter sp. GZD96]|uniref:5-dehydro-4-deoxy-D-glucuronate isomerase n=1 Tax=Aurantibrevibacter litoralis TaxID=3106030 RepID=UPI002AFFDFE4|nr:5-dehydro-4-deoxy-D-glucuronate isomerase [Arenibacter sp. GZD-96]MEA1786978.1 5-dehydro-4-deoxy-D-glucuronate isomerase [Arenibacter sp. GZD-96]
MITSYEVRHSSSPKAIKKHDAKSLRKEFLINSLMAENKIHFIYTHYDRFIVGSAVPLKPLRLESIDPLKSDYFLERREMGIINIGGKGTIEVDGEIFDMDRKDALYIARGSKNVIFKSDSAKAPANYYLNSTPAHVSHVTKKISVSNGSLLDLGNQITANKRTVRQLIIGDIVTTCQLQMGITELKEGNVWNTMPAHVHDRRMEVYFYLDVPEGQSVCHFMGQPDETRHIWVQNHEAVISPSWSIHSGCGTSNYTFIWGMAGENLDYNDMDIVTINTLR